MIQLDRQQTQALEAPGNVLVTACPGSGKSRLLSSKAARLLDDSERVCAVTFTKDAANELVSRIKDQSSKNPGKRLFAGTFHSLALMQLRKAGESVSVIGNGERSSLIRRSICHVPVDISFDKASKIIEKTKSSLQPAYEPGSPDGIVVENYQKLLSQLGRIDFADIMLNSVHAMRSGKLAPLPTDHLLVDESQDTDSVQFAWILEHAKAGVKVTIVGDDDQSIYGWRHALGYSGMMSFVKNCRASHVSLETNYRCAPNIIDHATRLIAHNKARVKKAIVAHQQGSGEIRVISAFDTQDEACRIVELVHSKPEEKWGILARTNRLLDEVEVKLRGAGIYAERLGGSDFWDTEEASTFLALLKSLIEPTNRGWITALHWAGVQPSVVDRLSELAGQGKPSWKVFSDIALDPQNKQVYSNDVSEKIVTTLAQRYVEWNDIHQANRIRLLLAGMVRWLETNRPKKEGKPSGPIPILRCVESTLVGMRQKTIKERLHMLMVKKIMADQKNEDDSARVKLITMHSSKGLEFENIVILAADQKSCPLESSEDTEEERRLFYVAMTRAIKNLFFTHVGKPSTFLAEAGIIRES